MGNQKLTSDTVWHVTVTHTPEGAPCHGRYAGPFAAILFFSEISQ